MADNILTTDRAAAPIDIAAKDIAGVLVPRNIITSPAGADISPLTDAELRASPVAVSTGGLTDAELRAAAVPVSGPVTDIELRAAPVPVSGTVGVSGTVPVSAASLPLPADAATQTTLAAIQTALGSPMQASGGSVSIAGTVPVSGTFWQATQPVSIAAPVAVTGPLTDTQLRASAVPVSGPLTDVQLRADPVVVCGPGFGGEIYVTSAGFPLPIGAASEATLDARTGSLTETVPATDTASSGINGRLQRIAQNLTTFFGAKVTAITALATGGSGVIGWLSQIWNELQTRLPASLGIKTAANSLSVAPASDAKFVLANSAGTATDMGAGAVSAATPRVALADNQVVVLYPGGSEAIKDITRPANTTAYSAGDVVGGVHALYPFANFVSPVLINSVSLRYDVGTIPTGMTAFRLHFYSATPPSAYADNAAWDLPSGDRSIYLGFVDLPGMIDLGSTLYSQIDSVGKQITVPGTTVMYAYLQTIGGFTPASNSETLQLRVGSAVL